MAAAVRGSGTVKLAPGPSGPVFGRGQCRGWMQWQRRQGSRELKRRRRRRSLDVEHGRGRCRGRVRWQRRSGDLGLERLRRPLDRDYERKQWNVQVRRQRRKRVLGLDRRCRRRPLDRGDGRESMEGAGAIAAAVEGSKTERRRQRRLPLNRRYWRRRWRDGRNGSSDLADEKQRT